MEQLPFFVYGTLIPGQPNEHKWLDSIAATTPAVYPHGRLYAFPTFPMMMEMETAQEPPVQGVIVQVEAHRYEEVLRLLDELEEYDPQNETHSPYWRMKKQVFTRDGTAVWVWTYVGQPHFVTLALEPIPSNSWLVHVAEGQAQDSMVLWWQNRGRHLLFGRPGGDLKDEG